MVVPTHPVPYQYQHSPSTLPVPTHPVPHHSTHTTSTPSSTYPFASLFSLINFYPKRGFNEETVLEGFCMSSGDWMGKYYYPGKKSVSSMKQH